MATKSKITTTTATPVQPAITLESVMNMINQQNVAMAAIMAQLAELSKPATTVTTPVAVPVAPKIEIPTIAKSTAKPVSAVPVPATATVDADGIPVSTGGNTPAFQKTYTRERKVQILTAVKKIWLANSHTVPGCYVGRSVAWQHDQNPSGFDYSKVSDKTWGIMESFATKSGLLSK